MYHIMNVAVRDIEKVLSLCQDAFFITALIFLDMVLYLCQDGKYSMNCISYILYCKFKLKSRVRIVNHSLEDLVSLSDDAKYDK